MRHRRPAVLLVAVVALAACGPAAEEEQPVDAWTEPAWFAEQAQQREGYQSTLQSCFDSKGWELTFDTDGGVLEPLSLADRPRFEADLEECHLLAGLQMPDAVFTEADLRSWYRMDLDTVACIRHEGHDVAEPPSEDAYVEASLTSQGGGAPDPESLWGGPYLDPVIVDLPAAERDALRQACPERWAFAR